MIFLVARRSRSENRRQVHDAIRRNQGITKTELCRLIGLGWGTVSHHVRHLVKLGVVRQLRTKRRVFLYDGDVRGEQMMLMRLLRDDNSKRIMEHVRANPGHGIQAASRALDMSRKTIRRYLADLVDVGIVDKSQDYRPKFRLHDHGRTLGLGPGLDPDDRWPGQGPEHGP